MFDSIRSRITVAILVVAIGAILVAFAIAYFGGSIKSGSDNEDDYKRIITYTPIYKTGRETTYNFSYARIQDISSDSPARLLNPFGKTMAAFPQVSTGNNNNPNDGMREDERTALVINADAFEQYILIRLPPELGGNVDSVSAFRAYSNLDPGSKCLLRFRSDLENGAVLQDPCHDDIFRVSDGYSCFGKIVSGNPVLTGYNAIPRLRLSADDQGYLSAARPDGQLSGDGTVGEGRIMPVEEIKAFQDDPSCDFTRE
jgi:hypothetical protein